MAVMVDFSANLWLRFPKKLIQVDYDMLLSNLIIKMIGDIQSALG